jgi:hypothetical protein
VSDVIDYLIVGSGCSGAMVAQTLVEAGKAVTMLDVGFQRPKVADLVPDKDYVAIRRTEQNQYKYFIGANAEGIVWGDVGKGAQVTPPRQHLVQSVDTYLPLKSKTFSPIESLGYGGLGIGWGLQCWEFSPADLQAAGLDPKRMAAAYEVVSGRIGISATKDDAAAYTMGSLKTYQPSPKMDRNHQRVYQKYVAARSRFNAKGFFLGRTPLALLTKNLSNRKKYAYRDMDFYTDQDKSGWRPWITIDQLRRKKNFTYIGDHLVTTFTERKEFTDVTCLNITTNTVVHFRCRTLVLAANPLSTARIAMRSLHTGKTPARVPLLCNPYTYIPCIQPAMMGKEVEKKKLGFAQLTLFLDEQRQNFNASIASLYSYQSLMLFRIIKQVPLNFVDARIIMRYLMSGIVIMGVHHPDKMSSRKYLELRKDATSPTGDSLHATYELDKETLAEQRRREQKCIKGVRGLGLFALARINPGYGSSVHYAGTLPFSDTDKPLTLDAQGKLHGTKRVYVADSSGFRYLPAKGLTFTLLANAHLTAENILRDE